jgi:ubiquinone/menaquinone biosynthesis C-methylase UbiE
VPYTEELLQHGNVTAVDISASQLALAKEHVPDAKLIHADMMTLTFSSDTFDAVVALYSIIHLPREQQEVLISRIKAWLRPGGFLLVNFGTTDNPGNIEDWLGSEMYWSSYDVRGNQEMVEKAGFEIAKAEVRENVEDGKVVPFLWVLAKKKEDS